MPLLTLHEVEVSGTIERDGVAFEEVRHDDEVAVGGELVGDAGLIVSTRSNSALAVKKKYSQLGIDELVADDICEDLWYCQWLPRVDVLFCSNVQGWRWQSACLLDRRDRSRLDTISAGRTSESEVIECTAGNVLELAFGLALVLDTDGAAASWWVGCHDVRSA